MSNDSKELKKSKSLIDFLFGVLILFIIMMSVFTLLNLNLAILHYLYGISSFTHNVLILVMLTFCMLLQLIEK